MLYIAFRNSNCTNFLFPYTIPILFNVGLSSVFILYMISKEPECYHRILQNAEVDTPEQDLANLCSEIRCKLPHPNIAAARNEYAQAANIGKKPPVSVALVPNAALVRKRGIFRQSSHRFVIHRSDNAARPRLHLVPGKNPRQHSPAAVRREPCDKVVILGAAEFLGHTHRAPPFRRTWHHTAVLHALQSRHYQNRIRAGASEGVYRHNYNLPNTPFISNASDNNFYLAMEHLSTEPHLLI